MTPHHRLLFVDDEPDLLSLYSRVFESDYMVDLVTSGEEAINRLDTDQPYAAIVCDLNMPGMDGLEVLDKARGIAPDTVRIMLTGYASEETAIKAVNEGDVFKFLTKPIRVRDIANAVEEAVRRFEVVTAERDLLERTLSGSIEMMIQALSLASPGVFGRSKRLAADMTALCKQMRISDTWELETTAMLSQIGLLASPDSLINKIISDDDLSDTELGDYYHQAVLGFELVSKVPRLESVARNIKYQYKNYDGTGYPDDEVAEHRIPLGARMLRVLQDMQLEFAAGSDRDEAFENMREDTELYDLEILDELERSKAGHYSAEVQEVPVLAIWPGAVLVEDLYNEDDVLILRAGQEVSTFLAEKLRSFAAAGEIPGHIKVTQSH